jgi:hypothetical protein
MEYHGGVFSCDHCAELLLWLGAVRRGLHAEQQPDVISLWFFSCDHCAELLLRLGFMLNNNLM